MLNPDYSDMLSVLSAANVDFLVVGAFALAAHGNPRATGDIDIYVRPSEDNAKRIMEALKMFGAPVGGISVGDFLSKDLVLQIGVEPRRIDLLTGLEGIENFDEAWSDRMVIKMQELQFPVLGRATLIRNKRALGRPQDVADVAWLEKHTP
ncbi:MAG: hypothetical protein COV99_07410 [Bacteroidetes bacterium CG12_big_fil_rev_8_21_14_0_65_60_17]|nr:MAG: hypothetical protein COV99_07410 [Bacteroidetes bacterium CG12_big_fil_rev_8_21_14_0_65_60_17]